jgi:hypothetical protein
MARQNAEKRCFLSKQNGHCIQQVTGLPGIFSHVFAYEVPALLARKSREPQMELIVAAPLGNSPRPDGWPLSRLFS